MPSALDGCPAQGGATGAAVETAVEAEAAVCIRPRPVGGEWVYHTCIVLPPHMTAAVQLEMYRITAGTDRAALYFNWFQAVHKTVVHRAGSAPRLCAPLNHCDDVEVSGALPCALQLHAP